MPDITLRPATPADASVFAAIYAHYVLHTTVSFEYTPPSAVEMQRRLAATQPQFPWLCCEKNGTVIGYAYAGPYSARPAYDWAATSSVYLAEHARGQGAGRALYTALCAFLGQQGYRHVYAGIASPNPESETFHRRMGFVRQGLLEDIGCKFGQLVSVAYYAKGLAPFRPDAPPPFPFSQLDGEAVAETLRAATNAPQ